MKLEHIDGGRILVDLEPSDCLAIAQAFRAQLSTDRARDVPLAEALAVAFEALGLVGASYMDGGAQFWREFTRANVWAQHGPQETRELGATHHTDLDGKRADESAPASAEEAA